MGQLFNWHWICTGSLSKGDCRTGCSTSYLLRNIAFCLPRPPAVATLLILFSTLTNTLRPSAAIASWLGYSVLEEQFTTSITLDTAGGIVWYLWCVKRNMNTHAVFAIMYMDNHHFLAEIRESMFRTFLQLYF